MRAEERQKYILDTAIQDSFVSIAEAALYLDVSIETVRRDINVLCGENKLFKVRGGASPVKIPLRRDAAYLLRKNNNQRIKMNIGSEAAKLIRDNNVVFFDSGVSMQDVAACVTHVHNVTLLTNSIPVMSILLDKFAAEDITGRLIMIGGEIDPDNRFAKGTAATDVLDKYSADLAFISCTALSAEGVSSFSLDESYFSKHLMSRSSSAVLVAESEKIRKKSVYSFAQITDFQCLITDDSHEIPADMLTLLRTSDTKLHIVPSDQV